MVYSAALIGDFTLLLNINNIKAERKVTRQNNI